MQAGRLAGTAVVLALFSAAAFAQSSSSVVKVTPAVSVDKVPQGSSVSVSVTLDISSGYHINSNRPTESYLIPTAIKIQPPAGISTSAPVYPRGEMKKFGFSPKPLSVYEGRATIKFGARVTPAAAVGSHSIHGKLTVQACNDQQCLAPKTIDVDIPVEVVARRRR